MRVIFNQLIDRLANRSINTVNLFIRMCLLNVPPFNKKENTLNDLSFPDDNSRRDGNPFQKAFVSFPLHLFDHPLHDPICLFLVGIESRLVRKGDSNRTILLLIPLSVVLFGLIGMGVADFEPVNKNSQSCHGVKHKMPFIHTVAVPERVAVQQNIPYYGASIQTCENMDSKALKGREKPGVPYIN